MALITSGCVSFRCRQRPVLRRRAWGESDSLPLLITRHACSATLIAMSLMAMLLLVRVHRLQADTWGAIAGLCLSYVPRNSKSGHQLIQYNQGGMLSLSPG